MRRNETEARIVFSVSDHHYSAEAEIFTTRETLAHQARADALALAIRHHSHWRKSHQIQVFVPDQRHWRKENVSDNYALDFRNERNQRRIPAPKGLDEVSLSGRVERGLVHRTDSCAISFGFWTNTHTFTSAHND